MLLNLLCINYFIIIFLRTSICTDVIVLRLLFIYFQFWDGVQHSIPFWYRLAKELSRILKPWLVSPSSFDVTSLLTSIPVASTLEVIKVRLEQD